MPWYDYQCRSCDHVFTEVLRLADYKKPTKRKCPECGRKTVGHILGNLSIVDPVNVGRIRPDNSYNEVISKINESEGIKGTRYELEGRMEERETHKQKELTTYDIKKQVNDNLKSKKGRGK